MTDLQSFWVALPELTLAAFALVALLCAAWMRADGKNSAYLRLFSILGLLVTAGVVFCEARIDQAGSLDHAVLAFGGMMQDDSFARFIKAIILVGAALALTLAGHTNPGAVSVGDQPAEMTARPEYPVLILLATLGMSVMVSSANLLTLYVGLELQSLTLYVLAALRRDDARSSEAGLKYFVLGALSSGLLLYGISMLYGLVGAIDYASLTVAFQSGAAHQPAAMIALVFICAALAFKVSAVPFHMWTPDVYEGAPMPVTGFFAAVPKIAAIALFTRVLMQPLAGLSAIWLQIIVLIAVASMLLGAFAGLAQSNLKRLIAYSSIANVGYLLVGIATNSQSGIEGLLIYVAIYFLNTLGIFAVLLGLSRKGETIEKIEDLSGLSRAHPLSALAMTVFMFSLAGVPPFAGFLGKYFIFLAAVKAGMVPLAVIGVVSSVIAAFYYLRIIKVMYFDPSGEPLTSVTSCWNLPFAATVASIGMIAITVWPSPIIDRALAVSQNFLG